MYGLNTLEKKQVKPPLIADNQKAKTSKFLIKTRQISPKKKPEGLRF
jgi:hypothetical protein